MATTVWRIVHQRNLEEVWLPPRMDHRWTTRRTQTTYCALEPGLAVAEKMAYVRTVDQLPAYVLVEGRFEGRVTRPRKLPPGWTAWQHDPAVRAWGDAHFAKGAEAIQVPSVVLPAHNVILHQQGPSGAVETSAVHNPSRFNR